MESSTDSKKGVGKSRKEFLIYKVLLLPSSELYKLLSVRSAGRETGSERQCFVSKVIQLGT